MSVRPDTFMLTLPSGQLVRCWQRQREAIREETRCYGSIMLVNAEDPEVYRFIPRADPEYKLRVDGARPG